MKDTEEDSLFDDVDPVPQEGDNLQEVPSVDKIKEQLSDEEIDAAKRKATKLIRKHPHLMGTARAIVAARQLYNLATFTLDRDLGDLGVKQEEGVLAVLIDSMNAMSMAAFTRAKVVEGLQRYALPLAAAELSREENELQQEQVAAHAKETILRQDLRVPIGFPLAVEGPDSLDRERSAVIAGPEWLVRCILNRAANASLLLKESAQQPRVVTLRFLGEMLAGNDLSVQAQKNKTYITVGASGWTACAETVSAFDRFMAKFLKRAYKNRCDLLIVDEIGQAQKPTIDDPAARAASAQRVIRKWADDNKTAVLCGMSLPTLPKEFTGHGWSQLEVFTDLRIVTTRLSDDLKTTTVCLYDPFKGKPETAVPIFDIPTKAL